MYNHHIWLFEQVLSSFSKNNKYIKMWKFKIKKGEKNKETG